MPIDFPSAPTLGQQYSYGGITYIFNADGMWTTQGLGYALLASPVFTGTPTAPTQPTIDESTKIATTAHGWAIARAAVASGIGVTDGVPAPAGRIGEIIEAFALRNGIGQSVFQTHGTIALPAGEWLIDTCVLFHAESGAQPSSSTIRFYISDITNAAPSAPEFTYDCFASRLIHDLGATSLTARKHVRLAAPANRYCVLWHNCTAATVVVGYSFMQARRIR
jgi:hypothetical protein